MDRRAALKKLAAGGAIAACGSMVLSSNNVAFAQSGPLPPDAPGPEGLIITRTDTGRRGEGYIVVTAPTPPFAAERVTYEWQIHGCSVPNGRTLVVINQTNGQIIARGLNGGCSPFVVKNGALPNAPSVVVRTVAGGSSNPKELSPGDSIDLVLIVTWLVNGAEVVGRYRISGTYPNISASEG